MDAQDLAVDAADLALTLVGFAFPIATPFIAIAKEAIPAFIAAKPFIKKAIADGKSAFHAAEKASPELGKHIKALAGFIDPQGATGMDHLENVTRATVGFAVPGWTDQQTQKWLDGATAAPGLG